MYVSGSYGGFLGLGYLAALDATTGAAIAWNPTTVSALAVSGDTVYVGGGFTQIGGQARNNIAALDAGTGAATAWNPSADSTVSALAVAGDTVYAWSEVLEKAEVADGVGALRTRLVAVKDAQPTDFPLRNAEGKYADGVLLDLDLWTLMPL